MIKFKSISKFNLLIGQVTILAFCYANLMGCTSNPDRPEFNNPYGLIRAVVIKHMPRGVKKTSLNGRTFTSNYFAPGNPGADGEKLHERAYAMVTILGDARPYQIEAHVFHEVKIDGEYSVQPEDLQAGDNLARRIEEDLANRRDDRNIIDDFRAF